MAVTVQQIEHHGHGAVSLDSIAKKLGVTRPALYRHFSDRRALLQAAAQEVFVNFEASLSEAFFGGKDDWDSLHAVGLAYVRFAVEHRGWFRLQFTSSSDERPHPDLVETPARYYEGMLGALRSIYGADDAHIQGRYLMLWSMVHGSSMLAVERVLGLSDEQAVAAHQQTLRLFLDELRAGRPSSAP